MSCANDLTIKGKINMLLIFLESQRNVFNHITDYYTNICVRNLSQKTNSILKINLTKQALFKGDSNATIYLSAYEFPSLEYYTM